MRVKGYRRIVAFLGNLSYLYPLSPCCTELVGYALAQEIRREFKPNSALLLLGGGEKGALGLSVARYLADRCYLLPLDVESRAAALNLESVLPLTVSVVEEAVDVDLVVDCAERLKPQVSEAIDAGRSRVSILWPAGVNPETGEVGDCAFKADATVTPWAVAQGLLKSKAREYVGKLLVVDIPAPPEAEAACGPGDVRAVYRPREPWSKKGDFGRVLIVGGSDVFSGAPALSALACLRAGSDIAVVAAPEPVANAIRSYSPALIVRPLSCRVLTPKVVTEIADLAKKFDVVVVGPGLGLAPETMDAVRELVSELAGKPLVLDADALKALRGFGKLSEQTVITPHAGELYALTGRTVTTSLEDRARAVRETSRELGCTVLLKGHVDVVSDGEEVRLNFTGNPAMTVGGTGDVLTGVLATFLAWSGDPLISACAAAFVNGLAGDYAASRLGCHLTPLDVIDELPRAIDDSLTLKVTAYRRLKAMQRVPLHKRNFSTSLL